MSRTTVTAPIKQKYDSDIYGTHESRRGVGGFQSGFTDLNDVYNIPVDRREPLMLASIRNYGGSPAIFWLKTTSSDPLVLADNSLWELLPIGLETGGVQYKGLFSAQTGLTEGGETITDPPTLSPATSVNGDFFICNEAGTIDFGIGSQVFQILDYAIYDGVRWRKLEGSGVVDWDGISGKPQIIIDIGDGTFVPVEQTDFDALELRVDVLEANQLVSTSAIVAPSNSVTTEEAVINYTYSKGYIDILFTGVADSSLVDFNWNRPIKRLPAIGETPGGLQIQEGLESVYYLALEPTVIIEPIDPKEVGYSQSAVINGFVNPREAVEIVSIEIQNAATSAVVATITPDSIPNITYINETLPAAIVTVGEIASYKIVVQYRRVVSGTIYTEESETEVYNGVYPILYGAGINLGASDLYTSLNRLVQGQGNFSVTYPLATQTAYIAIPEGYDSLNSITDDGEEELLDVLFPSTPFIVPVQNNIATSPWTTNYKVYISDYTFSATNYEFRSKFLTDQGISTIEQLADTSTYVRMLQTERDSLATLSGLIPAHMSKNDYALTSTVADPAAVDRSLEISGWGINNTGSPIPAGRYLKVLDVNLATGEADIELADKDNNDPVHAFSDQIISENGGVGRIGIIGYNSHIDTTLYPVGTKLYLGQQGTVIFDTPPTTGSLWEVGTVFHQGNPGFIASLKYIDLILNNHIEDWRADTLYLDHTLIAATSPIYPEIGPFLLRVKQDHTSAPTFDPSAPGFDANYDLIGGDMKRVLYDPDSINGDVFDMDNMKNGIVKVAMTVLERAKLAALEEPTYKGIFNDTTELRAAYPTGQAGWSASNLGTSSTWIWNAAGTPVPPEVGGSWEDSLLGIGGDMLASIYDPGSVVGDAFDLDNMVQGSDVNKIFYTTAEQTKLGQFLAATNYPTNTELTAALLLKADKTYVDQNFWNTTEITNIGSGLIITDTERTNFGTAYSQTHTHANKALLDTITDAGAGDLVLADDGNYVYPAIGNIHAGTAIEQQELTVVVSGGSVYVDVELVGGGDLPIRTNDDVYFLDCTTGAGVGGKARVELVQGTTNTLKRNIIYAYLNVGVPTLGVVENVSLLPQQFVWIGVVAIKDDLATLVEGPQVFQRVTDAAFHNQRGRLSYLGERLRIEGGKWWEGVDTTVTITPQALANDDVQVSVLTGIVYQLHRQTFPALDSSTDGIYVSGVDNTGLLQTYDKLTNLNQCTEYADGATIQDGDYYNLVIWGAINKTTGTCKIYVNPSASGYSDQSEAYNDDNDLANLSVPDEFRTVAFLIARIPLKYTNANNGTIEFINPVNYPTFFDLRGESIHPVKTNVYIPSFDLITDNQVVGTTVDPSRDNTAYILLPEMTTSLTPTKVENKIKIKFNGTFEGIDKEDAVDVAIFIDTVIEPNTTRSCTPRSGRPQSVTIEKTVSLSPVAHTIEVRWRTAGDSVGAIALGVERILMVEEWKQ